MDILKNTDWSKVSEAYQIFINTGEIMLGVLRPQVEKSWRRNKNIDPWTPRPKPICDSEYNELLKENADLLEFSKPIMEYMYATNGHEYEDNLIQIVEKTGVVLDFFTRVCALPNPQKKRLSEAEIGTGLTGLVMVEKAPMELGGPEYLKVCYQTCFGGAAPIKDRDGNLLAIIALFNNYGKIPEQPLEFVEMSAHLIEDMLSDKSAARKNPIVNNRYFTKMLNYIDYYILIVDKKGQIINFNNQCETLLGLEREKLVGRSCHEFGIILDELISDSFFANRDYFQINAKGQSHTCLLQNNKTIHWGENPENTLLLFNIVDPLKANLVVNPLKGKTEAVDTIIGKSSATIELIKTAKRAAKVPTSVLIEGESGTGKEVLARAIHNASARASKPFIAINCGAIPKEIIQSEFFGYEEGTFTGGRKGGKIGQFEAADGGTVLLDEIGEMPMEMQVSLLRFLQDKTVIRVGGQTAKKIDVRIIAATNRDLQKHVADGLFREDLFYRLKVIHVTIPPLRERKDDIFPIANYYLEHYSTLYDLKKKTLRQETKNLLFQYNWPGNIRELANVIENALVFCDSDEITPDLLPAEILQYKPGLLKASPERTEQQEKEIVMRALNQAKGNVSQAAKSIGVSRNTLYRKIDKYGLQCLK